MEFPQMFPGASEKLLREKYVGKHLHDEEIVGPQAVLDLAVVKKNCRLMLEAMQKLNLSFRAHVKTHKTIQVTRLQVGEAPNPVKLIVSTVAEAEHLLPFLKECKANHRLFNVLYGIPPSCSSIRRLLTLRDELGPKSMILMIDAEDQLELVAKELKQHAAPIWVFVKIDTGYSRAGLNPEGVIFKDLIAKIRQNPRFILYGFYCHHGSSYGVSSPIEALSDLEHEIRTLMTASSQWSKQGLVYGKLVLSAGATPTVASAQNLLSEGENSWMRSLLRQVQEEYDLELHAGVYPFLDLQQLATHARPSQSQISPTMNSSDIGFRVLAEVLSKYDERKNPEMLIGAGTLALGREPCKNYDGWGVVAASLWELGTGYNEQEKTAGWIVGRISQEHGILTWQGPKEQVKWLVIGERILIWPNHACIAGAGYDWYLVVDSAASDGDITKVVDVWSRCRGW